MDFVKEQSYTPFVKPYVHGATEEYAAEQQDLRNKYDENVAQYDALSEAHDNMKFLNWKADDVAAKDNAFKNAQTALEEAAKVGDYENKGRLVRKAIRDFQEQYTPVLNNYNADMKQREENMKFDKISDPTKRLQAYNVLSKLYNNIPENKIQYDKKGKVIVQPYQTHQLSPDVDLTEKADKIISGWKADKSESIPHKVTYPDGTVVWQNVSIEKADPEEIKNAAMSYLQNDPASQAYLKQEHLLNRGSYDINKEDQNVINKARERYPDATDEQIMGMIHNTKSMVNAANFAGNKHGFESRNLEWKFDPEWEHQMKQKAEKEANSATAIVTSSTTDNTVDIKNLETSKKGLQTQIQNLNSNIQTANDPIVKQELITEKSNLEHKLRLKSEFQDNVEKKMSWNWGSNYANYAKNVIKNGEKPLPPEKFIDMVKTGNFPNVGMDQLQLYTPKAIDEAKKYYQTYRDKVEQGNKEGKFTQEHELVIGNDQTYSGKYTKNIEKGVKDGTVELINQDGSQFDLEKQFEDVDLNTISIIPTKGLMGGKPAFAVTATKKDGTGKKTYFTTMDDNSSNLADYQQNGYDLLEQSHSSKYANSPMKKKQLADAGLMQIGYSDVGKDISDMNLPLVKGGTPEKPTTLHIPNKPNLALQVFEEKGVKYYKLVLTDDNGNPTGKYLKDPHSKKDAFNSEEGLMRVWGIYSIANSPDENKKKFLNNLQ